MNPRSTASASSRPLTALLASLLAVQAAPSPARADGTITDHTAIVHTVNLETYGRAIARLGDLNGDGKPEYAFGGKDDTGAGLDGTVFLASLEPDGTLFDQKEITEDHTVFGRSVARVGDLDGNGVTELVVGSFGSIWIVFLASNGTAVDMVEIDSVEVSGVGDTLFGAAVASLDDIDGDGLNEIVVSSPGAAGKVWILSVDSAGALLSSREIAAGGTGGFTGDPTDPDNGFGQSLARVGDVDGDGTDDLAVGASRDDDGGASSGAVWILFLAPNGLVTGEQKISATAGGFGASLGASTQFGYAASPLGQYDGAAGPDLLVSSFAGDLWFLFLRKSGRVRSYLEYTTAELGVTPSPTDNFGHAVSVGDDLDGDGNVEFLVGAGNTAGGGISRGAVYVFFHDGMNPAAVEAVGCDINPPDSLTVTTPPTLGGTLTFEVDNPIVPASQNANSLPIVGLGVTSFGGCGLSLPNWHMDPAEAFGKLHLATFDALAIGSLWQGPGQPEEVAFPVPQLQGLLGLPLFAQGFLYDPTGGPSGLLTTTATRAVLVTIGT